MPLSGASITFARWGRRGLSRTFSGARLSVGPPTLPSVDPETLREWIAEHPPPDEAFRQSLAHVAERVLAGEDLRFAVRELLDELSLLPRADLRERAIADRPADTGDPRADAYLGALAEHLAAVHDLSRPEWSIEPGRFLSEFWFPGLLPAFRPMAIAQSPAAFRRRGIFIPTAALDRC